jgi:DNA replication protein DnaC
LLVFDDLGAERGTEFAREQVYNVVNARWESGRPFIVTTNLTLQEMQNEEQMVLKRIYDRVLDVCRPVVFWERISEQMVGKVSWKWYRNYGGICNEM